MMTMNCMELILFRLENNGSRGAVQRSACFYFFHIIEFKLQQNTTELETKEQ